ncbi:MAG TPA: thiosulfate oxidation carrier complex protein SoxZ [Burkholderiales bacterium]|nr:thiosulfate oxidation carrier complex protein SoxZ [Burkholderiales bacterium]
MARAIVKVPARARRGEIIELRAIVAHVMETGFRRTETGALVPRDIIRQMVCRYNGVEVFRADFHPAVAANPLIVFTTLATESGRIEFRWTGDNGFAAAESAQITVE